MLKDIPRYECLLAASEAFPEFDISATEAMLHLLRTGDGVFRVLNGHLQEHGFSQGRFTVMMLLWHEAAGQSLTPAALADQAMVTRATMTGLLDTMEKDGLIHRVPCAQDQRMSQVSLSEKGRSDVERILPEHFRRMAQLFASLSLEERKTFLSLLQKIAYQADIMAQEMQELKKDI